MRCSHECRNQGICWGGRCLCHPGFEGEDCSLVSACPEDCSSHGVCHHGKCFCDAGFDGLGCELPVPCPAHCSNRGICQHGRCYCDAGFGGPDCSLEMRCPVSAGRVCSARGLCVLGSCVCVAGVGGFDCSQVFTAAATLALRGSTATDRSASVENSELAAGAGGLVEYRTRPVLRAASPRRRLLYATPDTRRFTAALQLSEAQVPMQGASEPPATGVFGRTASQQAAGVPAAHVWPSSARTAASADASAPSSIHVVARASPSLENVAQPTPSSVCLDGCSDRGVCFFGKCVCDPGWTGEACSVELHCEADCHNRGVCTYGICWCDPGWSGPACEDLVPCPASCSGHGTCSQARCYCDEGWQGTDCATPAVVTKGEGVSSGSAAMLLGALTAISALGGWGVKHAVEQRQRRKMREILQQEAQRPFSSGLPSG